MKNVKHHSEKIMFLIKNGLPQACLFGCIVIAYCLVGQFTAQSTSLLHALFYTVNLATFLVLLFFNQSKPAFYILSITLGYIIINILKNTYGSEYLASPAYQNLCLFMLGNLLFFSLVPNRRLLSKSNFAFLLLICLQFSLGEHLTRHNISLNLFSSIEHGLSGLALILSGISLLILFAKMTLRGSLFDYGIFFATLCISLGVENSTTASGLSLFFTTATILLLYSLSRRLYSETYKDTLTGLDSRNSYIIQTKKFPLKYSIGLISIDDYDKLASSFGRKAQNTFIKLIANQIQELEKEESIFRYTDDEFIIVFRNMDKKETFNRLENIRRTIAAASFRYHPRRNPVKLTISAAVSEKKRSDADSFEVLQRAGKTLQKTRAFSHNVTSQA